MARVKSTNIKIYYWYIKALISQKYLFHLMKYFCIQYCLFESLNFMIKPLADRSILRAIFYKIYLYFSQLWVVYCIVKKINEDFIDIMLSLYKNVKELWRLIKNFLRKKWNKIFLANALFRDIHQWHLIII